MAKDNINGVAYNTKTAEIIARNGSGKTINHSDERWFSETLYRKKSGEFFLYGSGGIFTKYARKTGPNSWERSEAILPLTEDEVKQLAMNNLGDDGYKDICQRIEEKPVPVVNEKRQYNRRESSVTPEEVETIINSIRQNPSISQIDLAQKTGLSRSTVVIIMDTLKDVGRLTRVGSRRKGQWVIDGDLEVAEPQIIEEKKVEEKTHKTKAVEKEPASNPQNNDNERIEKILDALRKQPNITQLELAKETKMSLLKVNTILQHLRADGKIIREGTSKKGSWLIAGEEPNTSAITVYGMHTCPDCSFIEDQIRDNDGFRFVDIGSHVKNLKAFMALRDSDPVFDSVKNKGIGIPAFVHEDGTVTLIPEDVGLKSRQKALLEKQRREEAKEAAKKPSGKTARKAAPSVQTDAAKEANTKKIIGMIKKNPSVSQSDFQKATNLSRMQVVTILNHLKYDGKLEHTGSKRAGQWVLKEGK